VKKLSGRYSVPNVYIGGKNIGGCDETHALHNNGQLKMKLDLAGVQFIK